MEHKRHRYDVMDVDVFNVSYHTKKRHPIRKQTFSNVKNGMKMFEFL